MATWKSAAYDGRYLQLDISESVNVVGNSSTLSWTLTSTGGASTYYTIDTTTVTINGTTVFLAFLYQVAVPVKGKSRRRCPARAKMFGIVAGKAQGFQVLRVQADFRVVYIGGGQVLFVVGDFRRRAAPLTDIVPGQQKRPGQLAPLWGMVECRLGHGSALSADRAFSRQSMTRCTLSVSAFSP